MNALHDRHGRTFDYLRIAVTERCNLRCVYCMPEEGVDFKDGEQLLSTDELLRIMGVAAQLGVGKIRFTGGEPLVRKDITTLIAGAIERGIGSVNLTTNGLLLERHADALKAAGLRGINISMDTLDAERFKRITRRPGAERVLAAVRLAVDKGFESVKVNVVAMRGFNDDELVAFAALTRDLRITVRFIELMPFDSKQVWRTGCFQGAHRIVQNLAAAYPDLINAEGSKTEEHVFRIPGAPGKIAVIPAYTRSLCSSCNRIRLTADGRIMNCLYSSDGFDLRTLMREGADDEALKNLLREAVLAKAVDGWAAQNDQGNHRESMTQIGG